MRLLGLRTQCAPGKELPLNNCHPHLLLTSYKSLSLAFPDLSEGLSEL